MTNRLHYGASLLARYRASLGDFLSAISSCSTAACRLPLMSLLHFISKKLFLAV